MRRLAWAESFRRAFKRAHRRDVALQERILSVLARLAENPFDPLLRTHKLRGQLQGLWACWVEYDCRIVFTFHPDPSGEDEMIVLVDIGSHDEVY